MRFQDYMPALALGHCVYYNTNMDREFPVGKRLQRNVGAFYFVYDYYGNIFSP